MIPENPIRSAIGMLFLVGVLYAIEFADMVMPGELDDNGIIPRTVDGLDGIAWAPVLHAGWAHLAANSVPLVVLGWLVLSGGFGQFLGVTATIWALGGVGTWLFGVEGSHVGASGIVFGWMVFLLARGFFIGSMAQMFVALLLFFYWGGLLWGVLPSDSGVSWEGHLFGALAGLLAAWLVSRRYRGRPGALRTGGVAG